MSRFLEPLVELGVAMIINTRSGRSVASSVEVATTRRQRRRGLLGRDGLVAGSAFVLTPCHAVHTVGMRFAIDVIFVDDEGQVVKTVSRMGAWRIATARGASTTIELWAGALNAVDVRVGDRLCLVPAFADGAVANEMRPAARPRLSAA